MEKKKLTKNDSIFLLALAVICGVMVMYYFDHQMSEYNTTLYALSYKYGFLSRGIVGTVWQWLDGILPFDLMNYYSIYNTNLLITALFYGVFFVFYAIILKVVPQSQNRNAKYLILFLSIFTFPMFVTRQNMGRIDIYLIMITLFCIWLLIYGKAEWLIVPLCAFAMLIHQGFVFTNVNIILVLLLYKALAGEQKKKYGGLFCVTFLVVSAMFLYFEFCSHNLGQDVYDELVAVSKQLSPNGNYYEMLLKHEILGQDVYEDESFWHLQNRIELPMFLVLFLPYLILAYRFFRDLFSGLDKKQNITYFLVVAGAGTLLPEWLLKVDFGRYVYATVFYYIVIILALMCMQDAKICDAVDKTKCRLKEKSVFSILLLVYPVLFMPLYDTEISRLTYAILRFIVFRE